MSGWKNIYKMDYKQGDIIINPFYNGRDTEKSDSEYYMLCKIERILPHKMRRGGIAYRLVTIEGNRFITNASLSEIEYVQNSKVLWIN